MNKKVIIVLLIFLSNIIVAQEYVPNTKGEVVISGEFGGEIKSKSGQIFLYEMIGNLEYVLDSTRINNMRFSFSKKTYYSGVYRLALNNSNYLDFVINPAELKGAINVKINSHRINKNYIVENSIENKIKKQYDVKDKSIASKIKLVKKSNKTRDQKMAEINSLQDEVFQYGLSMSNKYPGTYYGMILSSMQSPYKDVQHLYFNDIDFSDQCIIRSNLLPVRIQNYIRNFNNIKNNQYGFHDAVDVIMEYAKKNEKVAEFCMFNMLDGFYNTGQTSASENQRWDELCNYIMDEYIFGEGCGDDVTPSTLLKERASHFKSLQVGGTAPSFSYKDMNGKLIELDKICKRNKHTVLMFWASHCTHCMAELPGFASWYNNNKPNDMEIVAVSLDGQKGKWEKTVRENKFNWTNICQFKVFKSPICIDYKIKKTPAIFVLNENMEVLSKPRNTAQLRAFLAKNK
ncbi:MAG: hypothetical protein CMP65_02850 [Flavobacteriales bacterium]|nr:hypothetical protein [Flavobacteriales bacterium]|tara:strand:- start:130 stop:1506 length:1377 start_codon:yes stop_codon:yes gene_type:complete